MRFLTGVAVWRRHFRGYEEVRTPAVKTAGLNAGERLVPVEEMEPWAQSAFKGFKYAASPFLNIGCVSHQLFSQSV